MPPSKQKRFLLVSALLSDQFSETSKLTTTTSPHLLANNKKYTNPPSPVHRNSTELRSSSKRCAPRHPLDWTKVRRVGLGEAVVGCWLRISVGTAGRLVVSTLKKHESNWKIFPKIGVNIKKCLKPPPHSNNELNWLCVKQPKLRGEY